MILLDSSAWIEHLVDGPVAPRVASLMPEAGLILTPTVVLYEVYKKLKKERGEEAALSAVAQINHTRIVPLDDSLALDAADLSLLYDLPMADAMVAATAKAHEAKIVTLDEHFRGIPWAEVLR